MISSLLERRIEEQSQEIQDLKDEVKALEQKQTTEIEGLKRQMAMFKGAPQMVSSTETR